MNSIQKWTEALRSGRYKQNIGYLRHNDEFCCLGVACDIYQENVGGLEVFKYPEGDFRYNGFRGMLPEPVRKWLGISKDFELELARKNDAGWDFYSISDVIEERASVTNTS